MQQLITITTLKQLEELQTLVGAAEYVSYDTETDGVDKESHIIGMSVAMDCDTGYYIVISYWDTETQRLEAVSDVTPGIKPFLETLKTKKIITQNGVFDCFMTENNFGVSLIDSLFFDTMIAGHLLDENRHNGLKELGVSLFGEDAKKEQTEMKASVYKNGGVLTKEKYELYKADWELLARYGAKDAILTYKLFCVFGEQLIEQGLDKFYFDDESMPLFKGPTYQLNATGLAIDPVKLQNLRGILETECMEARAFIYSEVTSLVVDMYPGTAKTNHFNIDAPQQLAWLLFERLGNEFNTLTKGGRDMCKKLGIKVPYTASDKRRLLRELKARKGEVYAVAYTHSRTGKSVRAKKVQDYWKYLACGKETVGQLAKKYKWCASLLGYKKNDKILNTYVLGIQSRMKYNVIRPSFFQHGTTSGRYSCRTPNFQNLPRDDKRVKACVVARKGKIFVGADYAQLEPRIFASYSQDERLLTCFRDGDDFYSVVGAGVFGKNECSLKKAARNSFAELYPQLRKDAKAFCLAAAYGTTAFKIAPTLGRSVDQTQEIIDSYFENFPGVLNRMLTSHAEVKATGRVTNLYGRPRRIPKAMEITELFPSKIKHADLPYEWRNLLNLAMNHPIQSTAASIVNRAAIAITSECAKRAKDDLCWAEVRTVLQIHDELVLEGPEALKDEMAAILKRAMEHASELPGVALIAEPKAGYNLAELK